MVSSVVPGPWPDRPTAERELLRAPTETTAAEAARDPLAVMLRRRAGTLFVDRAFLDLARYSKYLPAARPALHGVEVTYDVPYTKGGDRAHLCDVYRPIGVPPGAPIVLYVHGGAFRALSKDTHWLMGLLFARRGYVCININYRLAPRHRYPAALEDAGLAYAWALEEGARFGGDPRRIIVAGESAGGNLITALTVSACYERPEPWAQRVFATGVVPSAAVPMCAVLQVTEPERLLRNRKHFFLVADQVVECTRCYLPASPHGIPGGFGLADPLKILEHEEPARPLPPFFAGVGTADPIGDDTARLERALARRGVRHRVRFFKGEMHAFHAFIWRTAARECWRDTFDFLAENVEGGAPERPASMLGRL